MFLGKRMFKYKIFFKKGLPLDLFKPVGREYKYKFVVGVRD